MNESPFQKNKRNKVRKKFDINSERAKLPALQGNNLINLNGNIPMNLNNKNNLGQMNNNILNNNIFNHNNPFNQNNFNIQSKHKPYSGNPLKYNKNISKENKKQRDVSTANPVLISKIYYNFPVGNNNRKMNFQNINFDNKKFKNIKQPKSSPKYNKFMENFQKNGNNINIQNINNILNNNDTINNNYNKNTLLKNNNIIKNIFQPNNNNLNNINNPNLHNLANLNNINNINQNSINQKIEIDTSKLQKKENLRKTLKTPNKIILDAKKEKPSNPFLNYSNMDYPNLDHREKMEDYYISLPSFIGDITKSYFAIFDGHSGIEVAKYCKENLHKRFAKLLNETTFNVNESLIKSFNIIDTEISKLNYQNEIGSTATVLFIYKEFDTKYNKNIRYYACANVGDSKCYLIKKNSIIQISKDHKCSDQNEVDRIKKNGGIVFYGRVFGTLVLTRSIGDREMKKYGVCSEPYVKIEKIENDDLFIVLASDGVWDVVSEDDLFKVCLNNSNLNSNDICKKIIDLCIEGDTRDNVSCIVVKL